ncbi:MAG: amino acid permease, partial [Candidatus Delongbacteria bacterium]|nr:amino acid permease [Candidatus Delongbacteria bacterium]
MRQKLDRTLGFFSAVNISAGTMIGSAIFVLAGTSFEAAGPSSSLAIFLAGIAAMLTAFSFAELVTIIPTAGGGYAYVREATGDGILAFVTGWGFWIGYSMSCGLFALGFGTFLNYIIPFIPQTVGAYGLIIYITYTNIKGMKHSGNLQNIITTILLAILISYIIYGIFYSEMSNQRPFFTKEMSGMLGAMGFLYMTYIGYGLITTASEEVINSEKTIPRAIMFSLILVIVIKTLVFFIGTSVMNWNDLIPSVTSTPLIDTSIKIAGRAGGYIFATAGILATVSSINTAMMAGSRTSFAMARDRKLPSVFKNINKKTKTPVFSILSVAGIVVIATALKNLENISTVTSIFALTGYSLVNVALIIFRKKLPDKKRAFKAPFYPITPILGIIINLFLVALLLKTNLTALIAALIFIACGIVYYLVVLPVLKKAPQGITTQIIPDFQFKEVDDTVSEDTYNVLVPIASPKTTKYLLELGGKIAASKQGKLIPLHVVNLPDIIPLNTQYDQSKSEMTKYEEVINEVKKYNKNCECLVEPVAVVSRDIAHAIKTAADEVDADLVILGWNRSQLSKKMLGGIACKALEIIPRNVAILKLRNEKKIKRILYPYGGGYHSQITIEIIKRITADTEVEVTFLRIADTDATAEEVKEMMTVLENGISDLDILGQAKISKSRSIVSAVIKESKGYDLVILGASGEWGIKNFFTGSVTDAIIDGISCNGLIIKGHRVLAHGKKMRSV